MLLNNLILLLLIMVIISLVILSFTYMVSIFLKKFHMMEMQNIFDCKMNLKHSLDSEI